MVRENRLFLGNPGTGKSTLINCLIGQPTVEAGVSYGGGLTKTFHRVEYDGVAYMDTPGLADEAIAEQAAEAITQALRQGGSYKLFFMMRLQNGRVVSEDIVTLERVLGAFDRHATKIQFSVIFNAVDKRQYRTLAQTGSAEFDAVKRLVNNRPFQTNAFCLIPEMRELIEASNGIVELPSYIYTFMDEEAPSMYIDPRVVRPVDATGFEQQARKIQEEMDGLLSANAAMTAKLARGQQRQRERERASLAVPTVRHQRSPREPPNSRHYSPVRDLPLEPSGKEHENAKLFNRKAINVFVAVIILVLVVTVIVLAATHSSGGGSSRINTIGDQPAQGNDTAATDSNSTSPAPSARPVPATSAPTTAPPPVKYASMGCLEVAAFKSLDQESIQLSSKLSLEIAASIAKLANKTYMAAATNQPTTLFAAGALPAVGECTTNTQTIYNVTSVELPR